MPNMKIEGIKRALKEVHRICNSEIDCLECAFSDRDGYCTLTSHPAAWDVNDWKESGKDETA